MALGSAALLVVVAGAYLMVRAVGLPAGLGSVFHPADYAILSHHVAARRMARAFSVHTVGGTLGWAIAPLLVAGIAAAVSWRAALLFSGALGLGLAILVHVNRALLETPGHEAAAPAGAADERTRHLRLFTNTPILLCFAFFALQATSFIALQNFMPVTLHQLYGLDMVAATATVTAFMVGSAGGTMAGGVWADRSGQHLLSRRLLEPRQVQEREPLGVSDAMRRQTPVDLGAPQSGQPTQVNAERFASLAPCCHASNTSIRFRS